MSSLSKTVKKKKPVVLVNLPYTKDIFRIFVFGFFYVVNHAIQLFLEAKVMHFSPPKLDFQGEL